MMGEAFQYAKVRACLSAASRGDRHLLAMARIPANGGVDAAPVESDNALDECQVALDYLVPFHLPHQGCLSSGVPGDDDQAEGIFIQAMDNTRPLVFHALPKIGVACQERINQCIIMMAGSWMHDHPGCFIHDEHILVFIEHVEGYWLRPGGTRPVL